MKLAGHIKVLGGPYLARGPDVAQACTRATYSRSFIVLVLLRYFQVYRSCFQ